MNRNGRAIGRPRSHGSRVNSKSLRRPRGDSQVVSPERTRIARDLAAVTAPLAGYVEHALDKAGTRLLGDRSVLAEAWRRNQVEGRASMSSTEAFLGLDVGSAQVARGSAFVTGVLERSGDEGLSRLWESAATLPTPSEVDAPGLWLKRAETRND